MRPVVADLYCGLGGWAEGFISEGYDAIGYDIEAHDYGTGGYPGKLILRDVRSIHGSELKDVAVIVASPPCQAYSYRAMPWKRAKALPPPDNTLFNECFRIQREACEACEAAGRYIPLIIENVRGAQKWVGRAQWNYGSFYLWGDVPALMPMRVKAAKLPACGANVPGVGWTGFASTDGVSWRNRHEVGDGGAKVPGSRFDGSGKTFQTASVDGLKTVQDDNGGYGGSFGWDNTPLRRGSSKSTSRKAASAMIARIPLTLAQHIARCYYPCT